jgi:hypothetical protein
VPFYPFDFILSAVLYLVSRSYILNIASTPFLISVEGLGILTSSEYSISTQKLIAKKTEYTQHIFLSLLFIMGINSKTITKK